MTDSPPIRKRLQFLPIPAIIPHAMVKKNRYVVGVDGGGTKTAAIIADFDGNIRGEVKGPPSNFQTIGEEKASAVLFDLVQKCRRQAGCEASDIACILAGLTGAGRPSDQKRMEKAFRSISRKKRTSFKRIRVESDARVALEGAFKGKPGIILIAGTGSITFGKDEKGNIHRAGGWGRTIGDEGGGYAIGRDGLNAVTRELDRRGKSTSLTELVAEQFGLKDQESIIAAVYRRGFDLASLAPVVIEAASRLDSVCAEIVDRAATELTNHVRAIAAKMEGMSIPLAFIGSLLSGENALTKAVTQRIATALPQISVGQPLSPPAYGAVLMALGSVQTQK